MVLSSEIVWQVVDGAQRALLLRETVPVDGPHPLVMERKRLTSPPGPPAVSRGVVILTHGFAQNRHAFHLSRRSFANHLAAAGFDVFSLDFRGHGHSRADRRTHPGDLETFARDDLPAAMTAALALSRASEAFVLGHSLGALVAAAASPRLGARLAGLVALAAPYHFGRGSRSLTVAARVVARMAEHRWLRGRDLTLPTMELGPWLRASWRAWDHPALPLPLRAWAPGGFERESLHEYLAHAFDRASFASLAQLMASAPGDAPGSAGRGSHYARHFEASARPLLVIAGAQDLLAPPASVHPMYARSTAPDKSYFEVPGGHADLLLGRHAPSTTWRIVTEWLEARTTSPT